MPPKVPTNTRKRRQKDETLMLDVATLTAERLERNTERTTEQQGLGSTDQGLAVVDKFFEDTLSYVGTLVVPEELKLLSPEIISLLCLQVGISSVGHFKTLSETIWDLGHAAEREVYASKLRDKAAGSPEAKKTIDRITKAAMKRAGMGQRRQAFKKAAQEAGLGAKAWEAKAHSKIGAWLLDVCLASPAFARQTFPVDTLTLTEDAMEVVHDLVDRLLQQRPIMLPLMEPPDPWTSSTAVFSGYKSSLIRSYDTVALSHLRKAITSGAMAPVLEAINGIQDVSYSINQFVLSAVEWAYEADIRMEGFPRLSDLVVPPKPGAWEDMDEDMRKVWKKSASDTMRANRAANADRIMFAHDIRIAHHVGDDPFWVPCNMDYRGRVYAIGMFNFQRQDYIRAMFNFTEGKPLDEDGLYWLKVHLANTGDFGKVSKKPFAERVQWVDDHYTDIMGVALDYRKNRMWTEADSPFQFLAACRALVKHKADPSSSCHLPVSFDGTCSGLQHLAAMTRCQDTASLVNLVKTERPGDVYTVVAHKAEEAIKADLGGEHDEVARLVLAFGVTRSLVKRNVMTYSYSSGRFGMAEQHMEDTMRPLSFKVLSKDIDHHPLELPADTVVGEDGKAYTRAGKTVARYLAKHVYQSIEDTVSRPALAMRYLQGLAKASAHESKPIIWTTPLGMPVVLRCPVHSTITYNLFLHDRGVKERRRINAQVETKQIDKAKAASAVAPCFVHSMDATHLQQVVRVANSQGIKSMALVHDSFGCLPTDATRYRAIIKETFNWLYEGHDVLANIQQETLERLDTNELTAFSAYGSYNPQSIMEAEYAFA